jgi:hypothetical protein
MAKLTVKRGDATYEVELTAQELREFLSDNGHSRAPSLGPVLPVSLAPRKNPSDFATFYTTLNERGQKFFDVLGLNNGGISAESLATKIGFDSFQMGGLISGSITKKAKECGLRVSDLYVSKLETKEGKTVKTFYPGRMVLEIQQKPAI